MCLIYLVPDFAKNADLVTGLEWEDPLQVNRLSVSEERRLSLLITKIAVVVNMKRLVLRPFFQDYELVKIKRLINSNFTLQNVFRLLKITERLQLIILREFWRISILLFLLMTLIYLSKSIWKILILWITWPFWLQSRKLFSLWKNMECLIWEGYV